MLFGLQTPAQLDPTLVAAAKNRLQQRMERDPAVTTMHPGGYTTMPEAAPAAPAEAFQWGENGERLTPDDIASRRAIAQKQMAAGMDYSPVAHWTQGMARVAQALVGGMENRKLDKAARQNADYQQQILESLTKGAEATPGIAGPTPARVNNNALLAAIGNPMLSNDVRKALTLKWQAENKTPPQPHYWETNNGSLGVIGADGKPQVLYADPDPRMNFVSDGMGGGNWVAVPTQPSGTAPAPSAPPPRPVGKLTPIAGGAPSQGGATFR